ncbi:hypothetical protein [Sphingomonas jatrophae]|uniref:Uncharacterized protein n=1 Tax=Sphingomonas jatrophae TaxID=1166337 RepID=A0A1I6LHL9_9SPHN|nr:hypothetical protein [Sphingomonas jatrophae]SFS02987.1 hypothetical protein SAMN05192580_2752 [Sphingomonas jatrophae]
MRGVLIALVVVVLLGIAAVATGFVNLSGDAGKLPEVAVEGGKLPSVDADVGKVVVGTKETQVDVPKVTTEKESIDVPVVGVQKADGK